MKEVLVAADSRIKLIEKLLEKIFQFIGFAFFISKRKKPKKLGHTQREKIFLAVQERNYVLWS